MFNIIFVLYTLVFYAFLPFVVFVDVVFRKADLLFVSPEAIKKRRAEQENAFFRFVRSQIHTKMLRMIMHQLLYTFYAITLFLVVLNQSFTKTKENTMSHWYNYFVGLFSLCLLGGELNAWRLQGRFVSLWTLQSIATQVLLLTGGLMTFFFHKDNNKDIDRADISGNHPISIAETFIAAAVWMAYFRFHISFRHQS